MNEYTMSVTNSIELDNLSHFKRFTHEPPDPSYIAGFIDGDGTIFIRKIKDGYQSGFSISQCRTNILQIIRYYFGGSITSSSNRNNKIINNLDEHNNLHKYNVRNQYNLLIRNNEYQLLLNYLQFRFIIKEEQYQCLYHFNKLANLTKKCVEKEDLYIKCSELNNTTELNEKYLNRINIQYIAGLFDAEGCIYINNINFHKYYISISQKNHPGILVKIADYLELGNINNSTLKIYKMNDCLKFIHLMLPYLIVKYNQIVAFKTFLKTDVLVIKEKMYKICNKEKHEIETFNDLNQTDKGKERFIENMTFRDIKSQICKQINLKQIYKDKSEKMKGQRNHNFGKKFTEETKKKMSNSIRDAKGGVSDEIIMNVRKLLDEGYKNIDIQKILNLSRYTVSNIKNGEIVFRTEIKKNKINMTREQLNLSKRKVTTDEIIIIIQKYIEQYKPAQILEYLATQNKYNATIDIIKNIKRNLKQNKTIIYETELTKERYLYYLDLLKQFNESNK